MPEPQATPLKPESQAPAPDRPVPIADFPKLDKEGKQNRMISFLKQSTDKVFSFYGDHRTQVDKKGETHYGTRAKPDPSEVSLASCTGETPTKPMYDRADSLRLELLKTLQEKGYDAFVERYRAKVKGLDDRLLKALGFKETDQVYTIDALSGTEAELLTFLFSVQQNIVQKETGSGTALEASGKHSSVLSWMGTILEKGKKILGFEGVKEAVQMDIRNPSGTIKTEDELFTVMRDLYKRSQENGTKLGIHLLSHSKTGERLFGDPAQLAKEMNDALIVIDAAQMRLSPDEIRKAVAGGCIVFLTGSKFPGGPIFSSKVLMNETRMQEVVSFVKTNGFPEGFADYFSSFDFERVLHGEKPKNNLPDIPNIPALLKWGAVIPTIEEYFQIDQHYAEQLISYVRQIAHQWLTVPLEKQRGHFSLSPIEGARDVFVRQPTIADRAEKPIPEHNPIISFKVSSETDYLNKDQLQILHWLLNHDLSDLDFDQHQIDNTQAGREQLEKLAQTPDELVLEGILATKYHLGQAVQEGQEPASLRIAPGMEWYINLWKKITQSGGPKYEDILADNEVTDMINEELLSIRNCVTKMRFLLNHWDRAVEIYQSLQEKKL